MDCRLVQGTETLDLSEGVGVVVGVTYLSAVPEEGAKDIGETIELAVEGSFAELRAFRTQLGIWIDRAQRYQKNKIGEPVYLEMRIDASEAYAQTEILGLELIPPVLVSAYGRGGMVFGLSVTRRAYWQESKTQLTLRNLYAESETLDWYRIFNHNDNELVESPVQHRNTAMIRGDAIVGDLPAPVEIAMQPKENAGTLAIGHLYLALLDRIAGATIVVPHYYESDYGGSVVNSVEASAGSYRRYALTTSELEFPLIIEDGRFMPDGNSYNLFVRFHELPATPFSLRIVENGHAYQSPTVLLGGTPYQDELQFLDVFQPQVPSPSYWRTYVRMLAGAGNLGVDYVMLVPSANFADIHLGFAGVTIGRTFHPDWSFLRYRNGFPNEAPATRMVHDALTGDYPARHVPCAGPGLWLKPGRDHTLYFLWNSTTEDAATHTRRSFINEELEVKLWYYPRRRVL